MPSIRLPTPAAAVAAAVTTAVRPLNPPKIRVKARSRISLEANFRYGTHDLVAYWHTCFSAAKSVFLFSSAIRSFLLTPVRLPPRLAWPRAGTSVNDEENTAAGA